VPIARRHPVRSTLNLIDEDDGQSLNREHSQKTSRFVHWERFAEEGFAYGEEPNGFLREQFDRFTPGSRLVPAEGEGRKTVRAAVRGCGVLVFDTSTVGLDRVLATARN